MSLSDFAAAVEGYTISKGGKPPVRQSDLDELDDLAARYPDG